MLSRPELPLHLAFYMDAFWTLTGDRPMGFALGPIPFTAMATYARQYGIDRRDEFDRFARLMRMLDNVYLEAAPNLEQKPKPQTGAEVLSVMRSLKAEKAV